MLDDLLVFFLIFYSYICLAFVICCCCVNVFTLRLTSASRSEGTAQKIAGSGQISGLECSNAARIEISVLGNVGTVLSPVRKH